MADPIIVFCTTCKNRTQHLRVTLPRNLVDNPRSKFVILNYNTGDDLLDYLFSAHAAEIAIGRLAVYTHPDPPTFRMAHAKNMAHRCGIIEGGEILVNLDADNMTGPGFEDYVASEFRLFARHGRPIYMFGTMIKGQLPRGVSGRLAYTRQAFLKVGGYDEVNFNGWGSDDKDLAIRLRKAGNEGVEIHSICLQGISHNNRIRFKEYPHLAEKEDDYFAVNRGTAWRTVVNNGVIGCGAVYRNREPRPIFIDRLPTRIFGIGMHKTATTSLHKALEILGYDSWHWSSAHAAKAIWREVNNRGRSETLERHYALSDLPIPMLYKQLDAAYPGSKFILTVRNERDWLDSVRRHFDPAINKWRASWDTDPFTHRVHNLLYGRRDFDAETMLARYRRHNAEVWEYFRRRPSDLATIETPSWTVLCNFLGEPIPDIPYPSVNGTPKE